MSTLILDPQTDRQLAELAAETGAPVAEIVRRAVAAYARDLTLRKESADAKAWLAEVRRTAVVGDVLSPSGEDWSAEHDRL